MSALRVGVLALAAVLGAGFVVAVLHRPGEHRPALLGRRAVSVRQTLTPQDAQFGDAVVATTDVVADRPVRLATDFAPYRVVAATRAVQQTDGVERTHVVQRLQCLALACVPRGTSTTVRFAPLRVSYSGGSRTLAWPVLRVSSRVGAGDIRRAVLRVPRPLAAYHAPRRVLGWSLLALGAALAIGGAALVLWLWLPRRPARRREVPPLQRALAEAAASAGAEPGRRRRALEALARELEPLDAPLSAESRVLAWAPLEPQPDAISELTGRVREAVAR